MEGAWVRRALIPLPALCTVLMTACGGWQGKQLDTLLRDVPGRGTSTTQLSNFPHARYTFFTDEDPPGCVRLVQLQDQQGNFVAGDQVEQPSPPPGAAPETNHPGPVQQEIPASGYRVHVVATTARCRWMVEEVVNSVPAEDAHPSPPPAVLAPAWAAHIDSTGPTTVIRVPLAGIYDVSLSAGTQTGKCVLHEIGFRNGAGDFEAVVEFAPPGGKGVGQDGPMFLVAGARTVSADTTCPWQISVKPWIGALGGGTRGFVTGY
jgi:hypothetical protein